MNPSLRDMPFDQGLISRAGCIMKFLWRQITGNGRLWPLQGLSPSPNQWQEGSRETEAQAVPPAGLEAPRLGAVRGEARLNSNSEKTDPVVANVPLPPSPIQQKALLRFPLKRKE